ncbi:MmgE/PrpD family protein [Xylophilus sp. GOD-11R]|uniref:MmgE/PrpD family protein n=1 Tax=Xylophilus sp. GOD-11R TaxID=3089814 RepID=UPI00298CAB62|nr:MmgE/PrpD family protein [Xylophilus sp. GOD-11R]WPB59188.1 MmgE/PrpD family protein [Xylophilus sp. GOD-11R]
MSAVVTGSAQATPDPRSATVRLAAHAASIRLDDLPEDVVHRAKLTLLDTVGVMLAGGQSELGARVVAVAQAMAPGHESTVLGRGAPLGRASIAGAALANGTLSDLLESQDGWRFGGIHPSLVIASALALGEATHASGAELVAAIVAGYEVANRVAATAHPHHMAGGYMPNGTAGSIGSAAASGRMLGLPAEAMANALGIAGFLLPVSTAENLWEGYSSKAFHTGYAARMGVEAALMAQAGFEACGVEGSATRGRGFMEIMNKRPPDLEPMTRDFGRWYSLRETYFKFYPACRLGHAAIEAAVLLARETAVEPGAIVSVEVHIYDHAARLLDRYLEPGASLSAAQYSLPYSVAVSLTDRDYGMAQLERARRDDPAVLALARRTTVVSDADMSLRYPDTTPARVVVLTVDGRRLEKTVEIAPGDPRRDVTDEQVFDKFAAFAEPVVGALGVRSLRAEIMAVDRLADIASLLAQVRHLLQD